MRFLIFLCILVLFVKGERVTIFSSVIGFLFPERSFSFVADMIREDYGDANQRIRSKVGTQNYVGQDSCGH